MDLGTALGSGLVNGFALVLVALGFTIVYRATGVVNFANGSQMVLGGYVAWEFGTVAGLPIPLAMAIAVVAGGLSGYVINRFAMRPLQSASLLSQVIVLLAITEVSSTAFLQAFGPEAQAMDPYASRSPVIPALGWSGMDIVLIVIACILVIALSITLRRSREGLRMRMVASNRTGAVVVGVNPARTSAIAWTVGGCLAALSGALIFPTFLLVPALGQQYTFDSFAAVVLGGFGSFPGAVIGGLLTGVLQALVAGQFGGSYGPFVSLGVMLVVLLVKPTGLLGKSA
ncbi:MAG: branched-chain amino acid transport system / permease component family protein [Subtercola sp.]|jgi:branched-chain amino acid transport system permease protein|nr:branched-chain amino acid transport system / permease component family protein [Subtercola sp.]